MTAFEEVYSTYFKDIEYYLLALSKDQHLAEELTSQTFFLALKALPKFRGQCDIRTWLCAIAKNCYLSHLRNQRPVLSIDDVQIPDESITIEETFVDKESAMLIHRALHELSEPYKEVFSLRVFGQLSFADIGDLFGKTQNWACVTYHRARKKIIDVLEVSE